LGGGTLADVYRGYDLQRDRLVAIKIFAGEECDGTDAQRFLREIETAAQLNHPNLLPLFDSGQEDGTLFYVMPLMLEGSLRDRLIARGPMRKSEAFRIVRQVADALAFAHQRGIVHRDIKPDNVLMAGHIARLADFGIAKLLRAARKISVAGQPIGTPAYMAPEQVLGQEAIDHRADIYALGVLAYELITGAQPFQRQTAEAVMTAQLYAPAPDIRHYDKRIPRRAARIIAKCLAKNRGDRWPNAESLIAEIDRYLAGRIRSGLSGLFRRRDSSGQYLLAARR
jgi:serine/threonine-protein kinase